MKYIHSFIFGFLFAYVYEFGGKHLIKLATNEVNPGLIIGCYRLHHSIYGLISFGYATIKMDTFWISFGLGIILQHTLFDGFYFITPEY